MYKSFKCRCPYSPQRTLHARLILSAWLGRYLAESINDNHSDVVNTRYIDFTIRDKGCGPTGRRICTTDATPLHTRHRKYH